MQILTLIGAATIFYALFDIFASRAGNNIDANLSSVIFNGLGMIIPLGAYFFYKMIKGQELMPTTTQGMVYSILAGISIAIFSILLIKTFELGGLAYVVPTIYGGAIILTAIVGWAIYNEAVSPLQWMGISVIVIGIAMVVLSKMNLVSA